MPRVMNDWQDRLDRYIDLTLARRICPGVRRAIRTVLHEGGTPESILISVGYVDRALRQDNARLVAAYLRYLGGKA